MKRYFYTVTFLLMSFGFILGQTCDCTDCPVQILDVQTVTSLLDVSGLTNSTLGVGGQDVCEISIEFEHSWISDVEILLIAPDGSSVFLVPDGSGGSTNNTTWDISFLPCSDPVTPDGGNADAFDSSDFNSNSTYTGSYYPGDGCLEDLTGSANGTWTIQVNDLVFADVGEITFWSITFCDGTGLSCSSAVCEAEMGDFENDPFTYCETDPIVVDPIVTGGQTAPEYETTWVVVTNNAGSLGNILAYSEDADLTGYAVGSYYICGLNYLVGEEGEFPTPNVGNPYSDLEDLVNDGTICANFGWSCILVFIEECGCDAEAGTISITELQYCNTDPININPIVNGENTDPEYDYTFVISNYDSGTIGSIAAYSSTGTLTGYAAGQYWVCGLSYLEDDEPLLPVADGVNTNLDIQSAIDDETICADLTPGCFIITIDDPAILPILDFDDEICVGESSSITVVNYDPDQTYGVVTASGSFSDLSTTLPVITFTPNSNVDIEICVLSLSFCNSETACASITVGGSDPDDIVINGLTGICPGNLLDYNVTGIGTGTITGWTVTGDASIVGGTTGDVVSVQIASTVVTGSAELCVEIVDDCGVDVEQCFTIDVIDNELSNATDDSFCGFDIEPSVLIDGNSGTGVWTVTSGPGTVDFDNVNSSSTTATVDQFGDYVLTFTFQCNQSIEVPFSVTEELVSANLFVECIGSSYTVSFDITGGTQTYFVDGVALGGTTYTSDLLSDATYSLEITGSGACDPVVVSGTPDCGCQSMAGTIDPQDLLVSCDGESIFVTNSGAVFDSDDNGVWVLYADEFDLASSIILENFTGVFTYQAPLSYGVEYYIAYIVGDGLGGSVDLTDDCLAIADGTSVVFYEPLGLTAITDLEIDLCQGTYELIAVQSSSITGTWQVISTPNGGAVIIDSPVSLNTLVDFDGAGLYTIRYTLTNGVCSDFEEVTIEVPEPFMVSVSPPECSDNNTTYTVTISIEGGLLPYTVDGTVITSTTFVSSDIASGASYSFAVADANGCDLDPIVGSFDCECESFAGLMSDEEVILCADEAFTFSNDGTEVLDSDDGLVYVLHSGTGAAVGTVFDINVTGVFSYINSLQYGETYYVSAVVGSVIAGVVALDDECLSVAIGQPVMFTSIPELLVEADSLVCGFSTDLTAFYNSNSEVIWTTIDFPEGASLEIVDSTSSTLEVVVDEEGTYTIEVSVGSGVCSAKDTMEVTFVQFPIVEVMGDLSSCTSEVELTSILNVGVGEWYIPALPDLQFDRSTDTSVVDFDTTGVFEVIRFAGNQGCTSSDTAIIEIYPLSEFVVLDISCYDTNDSFNIDYQLIGDIYPYYINGEELLEGQMIELVAPSDSTLDVVVLDSNLCEVFNSSFTESCDCQSQLAFNDQDLYNFCVGDTLFFDPVEDFTIAPGDSLVYVFHDAATGPIDNIIAVSSAPFFIFEDAELDTNTPYFITAVIYGGGLFDVGVFDQSCVDTDRPRAVLMWGPSQTTIDNALIEICGVGDVVIPIVHTGQVPVIVGISNSNGSDFQIDITEEGTTEISVAITESSEININYVLPAFACENTFDGTVMVEVVTPEVVSVADTVQICNFSVEGNTIVDLSAQINIAPTGATWSDIDGNAVPDLIDFDGLPVGLFSFVLTFENAICGSSSDTLVVESIDCDEPPCPENVFFTTPSLCQGAITLELEDYIMPLFKGTGVWSIVSPGGTLSESQLMVDGDYVGLIELEYELNDVLSGCDSTFSTQILIEEKPNAGEAIGAAVKFCRDNAGTIELFEYIQNYDLGGEWSSNDVQLVDPELGLLDTESLTAGTYELTYTIAATDVCPSESVSVSIEIVEPSEISVQTVDVSCFGEQDGEVIVLDENDQPWPYQYVLTQSDGSMAEIDDQLSGGDYFVTTQDIAGCVIESSFEILEPTEVTLDLGEDLTIDLGDMVTVSATINIESDDLSCLWLVNQEEISSDNCTELDLSPEVETIVALEITDVFGCSVADDLLISINPVDSVPVFDLVMPNVFNPNRSSFGLEMVDRIEQVVSFRIYDRWGNLAFAEQDFDPKADNRKWDGSMEGNTAIDGVYVFQLEYKLLDGSQEVMLGSVTLLR